MIRVRLWVEMPDGSASLVVLDEPPTDAEANLDVAARLGGQALNRALAMLAAATPSHLITPALPQATTRDHDTPQDHPSSST